MAVTFEKHNNKAKVVCHFPLYCHNEAGQVGGDWELGTPIHHPLIIVTHYFYMGIRLEHQLNSSREKLKKKKKCHKEYTILDRAGKLLGTHVVNSCSNFEVRFGLTYKLIKLLE